MSSTLLIHTHTHTHSQAADSGVMFTAFIQTLLFMRSPQANFVDNWMAHRQQQLLAEGMLCVHPLPVWFSCLFSCCCFCLLRKLRDVHSPNVCTKVSIKVESCCCYVACMYVLCYLRLPFPRSLPSLSFIIDSP